VEAGERREIFYNPQHPYTKGLLNSVPRLDLDGADLVPIGGSPPDLFAPPAGCPFAARCGFAMEVCDRVYPYKTHLSRDHHVDCWLQDERAQKMLASVK
jgi:dipeptide transport system ATP-binding protein